jgi:hypothetical protein
MHVKNSNDSTANVRFLHGKYGFCKLCTSFILSFKPCDTFEALLIIELTIFELPNHGISVETLHYKPMMR